MSIAAAQNPGNSGEDVGTRKVMYVSLGPVGPDKMEVYDFDGGPTVTTPDFAAMLRILGIQPHPPAKNKRQRRRGRAHRNQKLKRRRRFT